MILPTDPGLADDLPPLRHRHVPITEAEGGGVEDGLVLAVAFASLLLLLVVILSAVPPAAASEPIAWQPLAASAFSPVAAPRFSGVPFGTRPTVCGLTPCDASGIMSWYSLDPAAVAWPHGPGWRLRVCGARACLVLVSTDAGPDRAMQRAGRILDVSAPTFEALSGMRRRYGLARVTVQVLGRAMSPDAADDQARRCSAR